MGTGTVLRRGLAARGTRTVTTGLAVAAAVAFLSGTFVFTDSIDASVQQAADQAAGSIAVTVTAAGDFGGSLLAGAPTLTPGVVSRVRAVPGVSAAAGLVTGYAMPLDRSGHGVTSVGGLGISVPADPRLLPLALRRGRWPSGPGQVIVDATTASDLGLAPGGRLRVALSGGARTFTVSGIAGFGSADSVPGLSVVGFASGPASSLLGGGGRYSIVEAAGSPGWSAGRLAARIRAAVGPGYTVRTRAEQADHLASTVGGVASLIGILVGVFAVVALIAAALLIANTFMITVAQRIRELALLRCVGASRGQAARLVLGEAALIGLCGGVCGLCGGVGLAAALRAGLNSAGLRVPEAAPVLRAHTIAAALAVGLGVTVAAAGTAALRAARSRPLAALSAPEAAADPRGPGWLRWTASAVTLAAGAFLLAGSAQPATVAFGAVLLLAGTGLAGPMLVRPFTLPARRALSAVSGVCGRLAGQQMLRHPRRVAGTAGALGVAVATVTIVATLAATFGASDAQDVRSSLRAGYVISAPPGIAAGLDPALAGRVARSPGVTRVAAMPCGPFLPPGGSDTVCGIDPATFAGLVNPHVTAGRLAGLVPGTMAVSARVAARDGWRVGQAVRVSYPVGGTRTVRIVAVYTYDEVAGGYLINQADYRRVFPPAQQGDQLILVSTARGAGPAVRRELTAVLAAYPQAVLDNAAGYGQRVSSGISLVATLMTGLLALSLLIGLIAVTTALALSVLERTREIGLLRAVGAEARQIRSIVRAEALTTVTTGSLAGLALGLVTGWPLARALEVYLTGGPGVPALLLAVIVPAAVLAGLLAAAVPARRAARLSILAALRSE